MKCTDHIDDELHLGSCTDFRTQEEGLLAHDIQHRGCPFKQLLVACIYNPHLPSEVHDRGQLAIAESLKGEAVRVKRMT